MGKILSERLAGPNDLIYREPMWRLIGPFTATKAALRPNGGGVGLLPECLPPRRGSGTAL